MKRLNLFLMALAVSALCLGCSSAEAVEETTASATTINAETSTGASSETTEIDENAFFENCDIILEESAPDFYEWNYYDANRNIVAHQYGFNASHPDTYLLDIDEDGVNELICNNQCGGDLVREVNIFRFKDGDVEIGSLDWDQIDIPENETYLPETYYSPDGQTVVVVFNTTEGPQEIPVSFDDFVFTDYKYE